jgi:hypothetical protein
VRVANEDPRQIDFMCSLDVCTVAVADHPGRRIGLD